MKSVVISRLANLRENWQAANQMEVVLFMFNHKGALRIIIQATKYIIRVDPFDPRHPRSISMAHG
jgi:hypothetical protein